jgi:NADH dehydrogenase [ubiquinone] 1 alpha subcomplex assembly factor 5
MVGNDSSGGARIFDRRVVRHHRDRAAAHLSDHDFLLREVADRLADRLTDMNRIFGRAVELGTRAGILRDAVSTGGKITTLIESGLSAMQGRGNRMDVVADEEFQPFAAQSVDLVLSNLSLHWTNDLPGALIQIRRALKPDGLFMAAMLGGNTLVELRHALIEAETAVTGGVSPRISPFADLGDAAGLLQRAGFALPVADTDTITVTYSDAFALMRDLRGMGETNAVAARTTGFTRRAVLFDAAARYADLYGQPDGRIPASFQILYLAGWAPHESQQKPLRPGSAATSLAKALGTDERPAGEKTPPHEK